MSLVPYAPGATGNLFSILGDLHARPRGSADSSAAWDPPRRSLAARFVHLHVGEAGDAAQVSYRGRSVGAPSQPASLALAPQPLPQPACAGCQQRVLGRQQQSLGPADGAPPPPAARQRCRPGREREISPPIPSLIHQPHPQSPFPAAAMEAAAPTHHFTRWLLPAGFEPAEALKRVFAGMSASQAAHAIDTYPPAKLRVRPAAEEAWRWQGRAGAPPPRPRRSAYNAPPPIHARRRYCALPKTCPLLSRSLLAAPSWVSCPRACP